MTGFIFSTIGYICHEERTIVTQDDCGNISKDLDKRGGTLQLQQGWSTGLLLVHRDYSNILLL